MFVYRNVGLKLVLLFVLNRVLRRDLKLVSNCVLKCVLGVLTEFCCVICFEIRSESGA